MQYGRSPSFERTFRRLSAPDRVAADAAITRLVHAFDSGQRTEGLGLKKLQRGFWEVRAGLSMRILFKWEGQLVTFVIVGKHDEIQQYLKRS